MKSKITLTAAKEPIEIFDEVYYNGLRKLFSQFGLDFFDPNYKLGRRGKIYICLVVSFLTFSSYTIIAYSDNFELMVQNICIVGLGIQGLTKWFAYIKHSKLCNKNINFLRNIFHVNTTESQQKTILKKTIIYTNVVYKLGFGIFCVVGAGFVLIPIIYYILFNKLRLILPFYLPTLTEDTLIGYCSITFYHLILIYMAVIGTSAADLFFLSIIVTSMGLVKLFKCAFDKVNLMLLYSEPDEPIAQIELSYFIRNIALMHQEMIELMKAISDVYFAVCFIQIVTSALSMALVIFAVVTTNWPAGYFYLVFQLYQLSSFCVLGTLLEHMNDEIITLIYDSKWYLLPVRDQKVILLMLLKSQYATAIKIGGVRPMNVNTLVNILKTIYTFTMMLIQFVN